MTLPTSGPLSLNDIKGEFGGPTSPSLGDYYAGGTYVPAGTTGTYGAVPSSGQISIQNFYGTSQVVISISNTSVYYASGGLASATTGYQLTSGGQIQRLEQATYTNIGQWCTPTSFASDYEAYVTMISGTLTTGTVGSWVALSSTQTWTLFASAGNYETCQFTVQIRKIGTGTVLDSATITLESDALL